MVFMQEQGQGCCFELGGTKKIPKFKTDEEAARFWETHSFEDYHRNTKEAEIGFVKRLKKTITIRLDPEDIKSVEPELRKDIMEKA